MRTSRLMTLVGLAAVGFGAAPAAAQSQASIAVHPSEVVDASAADTARVHALITTELIRRGANLVSSDEVTKYLGARPGGGCAALEEAERTLCLAELARSTRADRALLLTVAPWAGDKVVITGQVVSSTGNVIQDLPPFSHPRKRDAELEVSVREALAAFVPKLELASLEETLAPLTAPEATTEPATAAAAEGAAPPASEPPPGSGLSLRRSVGIGAFAAGAVLLGVGGYGLLDANAKQTELRRMYAAGVDPAQRQTVLALRGGVRQGQTLGVIGLGAGVLSAAAGAWLLLSEPDVTPDAGATTWHWNVGPGFASVTVTLP